MKHPVTSLHSPSLCDKSPTSSNARKAKSFIRIVFGFTVLLIGLALVVLPGPAVVVIPFGLAILGTEFIWAKKLTNRFTDKASAFSKKITRNQSH